MATTVQTAHPGQTATTKLVAADASAAPTQPATGAASISAVDLYSDSDDTNTDDEWYNQPSSSRPKPTTTASAIDPVQRTAQDDEAWDTAWDHQPESGPLVVPNLFVSPAPEAEAPPPPEGNAPRSPARDAPQPPLSPAEATDVPSRPGSAPPAVTEEGLPPAYKFREDGPSLTRSSTTSSDVSDTSLPPYEDAAAPSSTSPKTAPGFHVTRQLQIETNGISLIRLPVIPPRSDPILIRAVTQEGSVGFPAYKSIQASRTSGDCVLVDAEKNLPRSTTWYAPGPVRPPKLRLVSETPASTPILTPKEAGKFMKTKPPSDVEFIKVTADRGPASRACSIRPQKHDQFRWRYGTREEKREAKGAIMVFERIRQKVTPQGKKQETRKRIGQLLRNEEYRSNGSRSTAAGKGGRLMLDLNDWADRNEEAREIEILAISSCLVMLRKEMNSRRVKQAAVMATTAAIL